MVFGYRYLKLKRQLSKPYEVYYSSNKRVKSRSFKTLKDANKFRKSKVGRTSLAKKTPIKSRGKFVGVRTKSLK